MKLQCLLLFFLWVIVVFASNDNVTHIDNNSLSNTLSRRLRGRSRSFLGDRSNTLTTVLPPGPFVTPSANERVVIPDPPSPTISSSSVTRSNCPHEQNGLSDWSSASTWGGGRVPTSGNITIPTNKRVIVKTSVQGTLGIITIPVSSELIFGENSNGINFNVVGIDVGGKLTIGSETCRMSTPVTITLHGNRPADAVTIIRPPMYKGISVTGELSLHGKRYYRTWTRLSATVEPGDTVIMVQHEVHWEAGQEIVLVTTAMKDSREWHRNEIAVIEKVIPDPVPGVGAAVVLTRPVAYQHLGIFNYQGEVGLLTRTIKIQGNSASEPSDPDPLNCQFGKTPGSNRDVYGDKGRPCPNKELTGFGGHVMIQAGAKGFVEGVELYRMGQTNVLGRYPMHFHLLGDCPDCYFRDSSIHRSFYRCVSIHGTNYINVTENVAFDVTGFCYYLEDGVEHHNRIEYNLGAHIHLLGPEPPYGSGQNIATYQQNINLTLPADVAASAFYITNVQNYVIGNAASGGWAGFSFPQLPSPIGLSRQELLRPSSVTGLTIDGNTAHSTGWWWIHAGAFYLGGSLYYNADGILEYNAGRDVARRRSNCLVNKCLSGDCGSYCRQWEQAWLTISNTKVFLTAGVGYGAWGGRLEVHGYECHDCGLSIEATSEGFFMKDLLAVCRSQSTLVLPPNARATNIKGDGFRWYDTGQKHIIAGATFRHCGYRSSAYNQYDKSSNRGCGNELGFGCASDSGVWSFVTHSDNKNPEVMQATRSVKFENCGRRFYFFDFRGIQPSTNSGRQQNWYDVDGSVTGLGVPSFIGSGLPDAGSWWKVDTEAVYEPQAPLWFYKKTNGPERGLGHFNMLWDNSLQATIGNTQCGNGIVMPCDTIGSIKHLGPLFQGDDGLPVTAAADVTGPVGGFGWKLQLDKGAPKSIVFSNIEVDPNTPMLLSIPYPAGTTFQLTYNAGYCTASAQYTCSATFYQTDSIESVRNSLGNAYHVDSNGVLTFRIVMTPKSFTGRPNYFLPQWSDIWGGVKAVAIERFERDLILLPQYVDGTHLKVVANCPTTDGVYCSKAPPIYEPNVCPSGYTQTGYDTCTSTTKSSVKLYADGGSVT